MPKLLYMNKYMWFKLNKQSETRMEHVSVKKLAIESLNKFRKLLKAILIFHELCTL